MRYLSLTLRTAPCRAGARAIRLHVADAPTGQQPESSPGTMNPAAGTASNGPGLSPPYERTTL